MTREQTRLERIVSHPVAAAVNLGGNLVVLAAPIVTGVVLVAGYLSDKVESALAIGLTIAVVFSAFLWLKVRTIEARTAVTPIAQPDASPGQAQVEVLREVTARVLESFERFEYDNVHGTSQAEEASRAAASIAAARTAEVMDEAARRAVYTYLDLRARTQTGWRDERYGRRGATAEDMAELRAAHEEAVKALGRALRGGS